MTTIALMLAHDDEDIIESSIRHNLHFADAVFVVGLDSRDETRAIVERVAAEGHPVAFNADHEGAAPSAYLAATLHELAGQETIGHVIPMGADTFIEGSPTAFRDTLLADPFSVYLLPRSVRVPTEADEWCEPDPYRRLVHRRLFEVEPRCLAVLPRAAFADAPTHPDGLYGQEEIEDAKLMDGIAAAQLPVRNAWQFAGRIASRLRETIRTAEDGIHDRPERIAYWGRMAALMQHNALMSHAALRDAAARFEAPDPVPLVEDEPAIFSDHVLRYPAEAATGLDQVEAFIGLLGKSRAAAPARPVAP